MQMMPNYRFDNNFPVFTYNEAPTELDLDFNMLSDYLFNEGENDVKIPAWNVASEVLGENSLSGEKETASHDFSDHEDQSSTDDNDNDNEPSGGKPRRKGDKSNKSQDQIDRRRERNRVLARKTRLRKKFFFESLQKQVSQLATENEMLKNVIRQRVNVEARNKILSECKPIDLPPIVANNTQAATSILEKADFSLIQAIQAAQRSFVITDPSLPDNPIIFASKGFLELCGYQLEEVLGRNCRFLQGPNTDPKQVEVMRNGILAGTDTSVCLLNYRADGSEFYNQIFVAALKDSNNKIINYVGVQVEIKQGKEGKGGASSASVVIPGVGDDSSATEGGSASSAMVVSSDANTPSSLKRKRAGNAPKLPPSK